MIETKRRLRKLTAVVCGTDWKSGRVAFLACLKHNKVVGDAGCRVDVVNGVGTHIKKQEER